MAFDARVFKILIASPGDVEEERELISQVIDQWNALNSEPSKAVLLPVRWESHASPLMGDRPQAIINDQLVKGCDLLIGVFWTRIGSQTGVSVSGTVEEIEWFIQNRKPVMLYFSSKEIDPRKIDIDQFKAKNEFEEKMRKLGLLGTYENYSDFKEKLLHQLSTNLNRLLEGKQAPKPSVKLQKEKAIELVKMIKSDNVRLENYEKNGEVKTIIVKGNTLRFREQLKDLGGRWNKSLGGWIFPKSREVEIAEFIKNIS